MIDACKLGSSKNLPNEQVIAEHLSAEDAAGLKQGFQVMDINNKGKINIDELRIGLIKLGHQIPDSDLQSLMEAVSTISVGTGFFQAFDQEDNCH